VVGGESEAVGLAATLLREHGMHVPAIRPPTVPAVRVHDLLLCACVLRVHVHCLCVIY
jgi:7-keto-8-aminopelargonate synthetase-like enzyme